MEVCLNPTYIPLIQKPSCCAVACLQMILFRNGFGLHDQEDLAVEFGVKIRSRDAAAFRETMPVSENVADWGICTVESEAHINAFLKKKAPGLIARSYKHNSIHSLKDFLEKHLAANHDLWIEYCSDEIYPADKGYVHDNLIDQMDLGSQTVTLVDPSPMYRQRHLVALDVLDRSIAGKYGRETGFIVIEKR